MHRSRLGDSPIDNPSRDDNRRYDYTNAPNQWRDEYPLIADWVQPQSRVVDFGCGNGSLLALLRDEKKAEGIGYDLSQSGVDACRGKQILAVCKAIDQRHTELRDGQFDYAICNVTLQMVMYPEVLFAEMVRVARYQIVSFPNFAHYANRWDMLVHGRMPRPFLYGYDWFATGHIHQFSYQDFLSLAASHNVGAIKSRAVNDRGIRGRLLCRLWPNLFHTISVVMTGVGGAR